MCNPICPTISSRELQSHYNSHKSTYQMVARVALLVFLGAAIQVVCPPISTVLYIAASSIITCSIITRYLHMYHLRQINIIRYHVYNLTEEFPFITMLMIMFAIVIAMWCPGLSIVLGILYGLTIQIALEANLRYTPQL